MKRRLALTVNVLQPQYADLLGPLYDAGMEIDYIELMSTTDQDRVARELRGYDYVLAASEIFGDTSIPRLADSLKLIARNGVGVESVDIGLCTEYNIAVANMPGMNADGVGEYCISALLALLRNVCKNNAAMHAGQWRGFPGRSFTGTLGLIGFGAIAQSFARFCAGFPVDVVAYDMNPDPARAAELGVTLVSLEELLTRADFVSLHLPLTGSTSHFVDGAMFSRMKRGAYFINTSRGPVADEQALIRALQDCSRWTTSCSRRTRRRAACTRSAKYCRPAATPFWTTTAEPCAATSSTGTKSRSADKIERGYGHFRLNLI